MGVSNPTGLGQSDSEAEMDIRTVVGLLLVFAVLVRGCPAQDSPSMAEERIGGFVDALGEYFVTSDGAAIDQAAEKFGITLNHWDKASKFAAGLQSLTPQLNWKEYSAEDSRLTASRFDELSLDQTVPPLQQFIATIPPQAPCYTVTITGIPEGSSSDPFTAIFHIISRGEELYLLESFKTSDPWSGVIPPGAELRRTGDPAPNSSVLPAVAVPSPKSTSGPTAALALLVAIFAATLTVWWLWRRKQPF